MTTSAQSSTVPTVSSIKPTPASNRPSKMRSFSCSSSLPSNCARTCTISSAVASNWRTEAKRPPADPASLIGGALAAGEQHAEHHADAAGDADGHPGVLVHIAVGDSAGVLGLLDRVFLQVGQAGLGALDAGLHAVAHAGGLVADLAGRELEQFFGVRDDQGQVRREFLFLGSADFGHGGLHGWVS